MDDTIEERLGRNILLVEEATVVGGTGGVVNADVLGDFAGGAGEEAEHAVGDDHQMVGEVGEDGLGRQDGVQGVGKARG